MSAIGNPRPSSPGWSFSGLNDQEVFQLGYSIGLILKRSGQKMGISPQELLGPGRKAHLVAARHVAIFFLQNRHPSLCLEQLGVLMGFKGHRTRFGYRTAVVRLALKDQLYLNAQEAFQ